MEYLTSNKILIVDLSTGDTDETEIDDTLVSEAIGGAGITTHLYKKYEGKDPIVIGAGLLTGTLFPGSALSVISAKSPRTGSLAHAPITLKAGMEFKYTGFDYLVILGKSEKPVFLWLHDGIADIENASELWGKDVWTSTDLIRKSMGDDLVQTLVIGPLGEQGSELAQVCVNYWANGDCWGFGQVFGSKNLKGIALRGMGLLEISDPEEFVNRCFETFDAIKESKLSEKRGVEDILVSMGESDAGEWIAPVMHRHSACYNTPYASNSFVYLNEDPKETKEPLEPEPGFMITDVNALLTLKKSGFSAKDAALILRTCARQGLDPEAVSKIIAESGEKDIGKIEQKLPEMKASGLDPDASKFSNWAPIQPIFGSFGQLPGSAHDWWSRRQALAYIFGIHPIFAMMCPEISEELLLEMAGKGAGLELSQENLDQVIREICN